MADTRGEQGKQRAKTGLMDIPPEVVLEHLLPVLADREIARLSLTSRGMHALCNTDAFWLERTRTVFSYNPSTLAAPSARVTSHYDSDQSPSESHDTTPSWSKRLYIGLAHPRPYLWGSEGNGRQGLPDESSRRGAYAYHRSLRGVNRPKDATWQFERMRRRIAGEGGGTGGTDDTETATGSSWMAGFGDAVSRVAGYSQETSTGEVQSKNAIAMAGESGGNGIVELQAGGWSFAARDMQGLIWVWGQMDGLGFNLAGQDWHNAQHTVPEPTPVPLPCRAEAMSVGRSHMLVLDEDNLIWEMRSWGRAYHHTAASLTSPTHSGSTRRPHHIIQVSAGWTHSACLTSSGRIVVWYPFTDAYRQSQTIDDELNGPPDADEKRPSDKRRSLRWGTVGDIVHELPDLADRPEWDEIKYPDPPGLDRTRREIEQEWADHEAAEGWRYMKGEQEGKRVIKIACGSNYLVALRKDGEVWYRHIGGSHDSANEWEYLPYFSSPNVSHISASMENITSYSTSRPSRVNHAHVPAPVLQNIHRPGWGNSFYPNPLVELQGQDVIQVALGDYHSLALTARGEVYAWGQGDEGQLGLGREGMGGPQVNVPRKVSFLLPPTRPDGDDEAEDRALRQQKQALAGGGMLAKEAEKGKEEKPFVFAIAAAGWHSGALVLGDARDRTTTKSKDTIGGTASTDKCPEMQGLWDEARHAPRPGHTGRMIYPEVQSPPFAGQHRQQQPFGGPSMFRIGLAGAGALPRQPSHVDNGAGSSTHRGSSADAGAEAGGTSPPPLYDTATHGAAGPSAGSPMRARGGGLTGTIRNWVKRSAPAESQGVQAGSAGSTAAASTPQSSSSTTTAGESDFRPLSGGYAEAAQNRPPGNRDGPAFARGAGQSTYVPEALRGESSASGTSETATPDNGASPGSIHTQANESSA